MTVCKKSHPLWLSFWGDPHLTRKLTLQVDRFMGGRSILASPQGRDREAEGYLEPPAYLELEAFVQRLLARRRLLALSFYVQGQAG